LPYYKRGILLNIGNKNMPLTLSHLFQTSFLILKTVH
jgi:hypothetical protein